ncbi:MAG: carboxylating nicotinate-nucleotide diphosphorylase [Nitrospirae bacterium]|nr:carboxylating nicotinate-nucleotide diphosphorylase [Nitrospirota bacterium]
MNIPSGVMSFIQQSLEEDIGSGDITTSLLVSETHNSTSLIIAKEDFVVAGLPFVKEVFNILDSTVSFNVLVEDGSMAKKGSIIVEINGKTRTLLQAERTALNLLQRLSGIATMTRKFVTKVKGLKVEILDTRKTMPCMRYMEKYAVRMGGGKNHRFGLYDGILIKDNHIEAVDGIKNALARVKQSRFLSRIEVEAENLKEFKDALGAGADIIMLDNMSIKDIKEAVRLAKGKAILEVSGNVTLENVREIAETGVDLISVGAITHSAPSVDISMKIMGRREEDIAMS